MAGAAVFMANDMVIRCKEICFQDFVRTRCYDGVVYLNLENDGYSG